jgi:hypothetical protein
MRTPVALVSILIFAFASSQAQDTSRRRTIEITSSFKPSLLPQQKIGFTASPSLGDSTRPTLQYNIPSQNLATNFFPAPLRPLAFEQDTSRLPANPLLFVKAGYGNFSTPFLKALASFGDGIKSNGNVEGNYIGSKGKLPFQQYQQYGAKGNLWLHLKGNNTVHLFGGYQHTGTYRFGFEPKPFPVSPDSLRVRYNDVNVGASMGKQIAGANGVSYRAAVKAHFFSDNNNASETAFRFDLPIEKQVSDVATFGIGIKGMVSSFSKPDTSFSNNLFLIPVAARLKLKENILLRIGIIPSWNNQQFKLLPDIDAEYLLPDQNRVVQAGFKGYYDEQTFQSLAGMNPWIAQPNRITNTRNTQFYAALKANVNDNISYRIKAGAGKQFDVPLMVNDRQDGRSFDLIWEPQITRIFMSGEFTYRQGKRFNWNTTAQINGFSGLSVADKPYGLLPFELRSSVQIMILKDLLVKVDGYAFSGAWYKSLDGKNNRGKSAFDLNAGVEFELKPQIKLWLQFNNMVNMDYQRWNQYRVLGFQALGGVIFQL